MSRNGGASDSLRRLDEATGAATFGRWFSWIGGYWNFLLGLALIILGVVALLAGGNPGSGAICVVFGVVAVGVGLFIGPKHMVRRMLRRQLPSPARSTADGAHVE